MGVHADNAPSDFADGARSAFIYAPVIGLVGVGLFAIGGSMAVTFPIFLGVAACLGAAGVSLTGISAMISAGQDLLARNHQAAGLAIGRYGDSTVGARAGVTVTPVTTLAAHQVPPPSVTEGLARPEAAGAQLTEDSSAGPAQNASTDPAAFVALLKSLYMLDATRDVQRLYGNDVCAAFVNRKCKENGVSGVSLEGKDIPAKF